jgi:hypothetical protein
MRIEDWNDLKYFRPDEQTPWDTPAFSEPQRMNLAVMLLMDRLRGNIGLPIYVHCSYEARDGGQHPKGRAIDCSCPALGDPWLFWREAIKLPFEGIGVYENWNHKGLHLDSGRFTSPLSPTLFWWTEVVEGEQVYHYF